MNQQTYNRWWKQSWLLALLLVTATLVAYQPAWNGQPVYDDDDHLTPPELQSLSGLARIWIRPGVVSQYYPIAHSAFWLQHMLWGYWMPGYHLLNILLHVFCALLLLMILKHLEVPGAWLAAAIFALHPVEVESVAWISELKNTLSTVFYFGAALAYLDFDRTRQCRLYVLALALFSAGLLSKSVVASLPAALLVVFWWKRGTLSWKRDLRSLVPFFLVGIVAGLFTAWVERRFIGAEGEAFETHVHSAGTRGRSRNLVLPDQTLLARGPGLHLSALECQPGGLVAVPVSSRNAAARRGIVGAATAMARATGRPAFLRRDAVPRTGLHQRISVPIFIRC